VQRPPTTVGPAPTALDEADIAARLTAIWAEAIGSGGIGVDEDFFELGGNSLTAVGLMSTVRQEFAVELSIAALFDFPTIASLAKAILEQLRSSP
jgi:acyl carrier protein